MIDGTMMHPDARAYLVLDRLEDSALDYATADALDTARQVILYKIDVASLRALWTLRRFLRVIDALVGPDGTFYRARVRRFVSGEGKA